MGINKRECPKCKREISCSNFQRHFIKCDENKKTTLNLKDFIEFENGKYLCLYCKKQFKKNGICTHIWKKHTEEGLYHDSFKGKRGWSKGLTKETDERIKNIGTKVSKALKNKHNHTQTMETKRKISESMKKAHHEGRAFNIKKSNYTYYSKISQELFWEIYNKLPKELQGQTLFAELNNEKKFRMGDKIIAVDFFIKPLNLCIEYFGDFWHCNPNIYNEEDKPFIRIESKKDLLAKDVWEYDKHRCDFLDKKGIKTIVVWEQEYTNDKIKTIDKILEIIVV